MPCKRPLENSLKLSRTSRTRKCQTLLRIHDNDDQPWHPRFPSTLVFGVFQSLLSQNQILLEFYAEIAIRMLGKRQIRRLYATNCFDTFLEMFRRFLWKILEDREFYVSFEASRLSNTPNWKVSGPLTRQIRFFEQSPGASQATTNRLSSKPVTLFKSVNTSLVDQGINLSAWKQYLTFSPFCDDNFTCQTLVCNMIPFVGLYAMHAKPDWFSSNTTLYFACGITYHSKQAEFKSLIEPPAMMQDVSCFHTQYLV